MTSKDGISNTKMCSTGVFLNHLLKRLFCGLNCKAQWSKMKSLDGLGSEKLRSNFIFNQVKLAGTNGL